MPEELRTLRVLWVAFLLSQLLFAGVGFVLRADPIGDVMLLSGMLALIGVGQIGFAFVGAPMVFRKSPVLTGFILRFAFVESSGVFGLVVNILGGSLAVAGGLHLLSVIAFLGLFPSAERYTAWEVARAE